MYENSTKLLRDAGHYFLNIWGANENPYFEQNANITFIFTFSIKCLCSFKTDKDIACSLIFRPGIRKKYKGYLTFDAEYIIY